MAGFIMDVAMPQARPLHSYIVLCHGGVLSIHDRDRVIDYCPDVDLHFYVPDGLKTDEAVARGQAPPRDLFRELLAGRDCAPAERLGLGQSYRRLTLTVGPVERFPVGQVWFVDSNGNHGPLATIDQLTYLSTLLPGLRRHAGHATPRVHVICCRANIPVAP